MGGGKKPVYQNQRSCLLFFSKNIISEHSSSLAGAAACSQCSSAGASAASKRLRCVPLLSAHRSLFLPGAQTKRSGKLNPPPPPTRPSSSLPTQTMPTLVTPLGGNSLHFTQFPLETKIGFIPDFFSPLSCHICLQNTIACPTIWAKRAPYIRPSVFRQL